MRLKFIPANWWDLTGAVCVWCGKTYEEHSDSRSPLDPTPRVPCAGLKVGFIRKVEV